MCGVLEVCFLVLIQNAVFIYISCTYAHTIKIIFSVMIYRNNFIKIGKQLGRFRCFSILLFEISKYDIKSLDK